MNLNERAAKVMGWERCANGKNTYCYHDDNGLLHITEANFTTDIAQAWMLMEKCREKTSEMHCEIEWKKCWAEGGEWWFGITVSEDNIHTAWGKSAPEAITAACVEALESHSD